MVTLNELIAANIFTAETLEIMRDEIAMNSDHPQAAQAIAAIDAAFIHTCDSKCGSFGCDQTDADRAAILNAGSCKCFPACKCVFNGS